MKKLFLALLIIGVFGGALYYIQSLRTSNGLMSPPGIPIFSNSQEETASAENPTSTPKGQQATQGIQLEISSPKNGTTVNSSVLSLKGKTAPGAEVFVNDLETRADKNGNFSVKLTLDEGENSIFIIVNDSIGNSAERELTITYQP